MELYIRSTSHRDRLWINIYTKTFFSFCEKICGKTFLIDDTLEIVFYAMTLLLLPLPCLCRNLLIRNCITVVPPPFAFCRFSPVWLLFTNLKFILKGKISDDIIEIKEKLQIAHAEFKHITSIDASNSGKVTGFSLCGCNGSTLKGHHRIAAKCCQV